MVVKPGVVQCKRSHKEGKHMVLVDSEVVAYTENSLLVSIWGPLEGQFSIQYVYQDVSMGGVHIRLGKTNDVGWMVLRAKCAPAQVRARV